MVVERALRWRSRRLSYDRSPGEEGFTLIELMVVLLILAILLAIAIPTFLGEASAADDRAAQANLNTAITSAKAIFQANYESYEVDGALPTQYSSSFAVSLNSAQPNLSFVTGDITGDNSYSFLSVAVNDANGIALAGWSQGSRNCYFAIDNTAQEAWTTSGTGSQPNAPGTWFGESKGATTCDAESLPAPNGTTVVYRQGGFPSP